MVRVFMRYKDIIKINQIYIMTFFKKRPKDKYIKIEIKLSLLLKLIFSLALLYISIKSIRKISNKKINKTNKIFFKNILIK